MANTIYRSDPVYQISFTLGTGIGALQIFEQMSGDEAAVQATIAMLTSASNVHNFTCTRSDYAQINVPYPFQDYAVNVGWSAAGGFSPGLDTTVQI